MSVAALYDVHGNIRALDAVLSELRHTAYELDTGEWPGEWPSQSREEAVAFFETRAVGA